jgi:tetratricopeptide (TPR) repeat protein
VKKTLVLLAALAAGTAACLTTSVPPPTIHIEPLSPSVTGTLTLDERIAVQEAWDYMRQGRMDKAQKILARLKPAQPFALAGFGYIALNNNNPASAEDYLIRALEIQHDLVSAYLGLGQTYQKTGQIDQAYKSFLDALKWDPENSFAKKEAGRIAAVKTSEAMAEAQAAAQAGQTDQSKEAYLRALEYSPKLQEAHQALARLYIEQKDFPSALFHLKTASANDPQNGALLKEYADALFQAGQWSRSLDAYQQAAATAPQDKAIKDRVEQIKNRLGVVDLPDQFNAIASSEAVTKEDIAALIGVQFGEVLSDLNPKPPVIVDITTSWAQRYIVKAAALNMMEVYSNHTFQPKKGMNRAELAETLVRLIDVLKKNGANILPQIPIERIRIADVPPEHFYYQPIAQALAYQLMDLAPDGTFKPEQAVTGREAIKVFDLLSGLVK